MNNETMNQGTQRRLNECRYIDCVRWNAYRKQAKNAYSSYM